MSAPAPSLYDDVLAAARAALAEARSVAGDDLRAMALSSDGSAMTICQSFGTRSQLERLRAEHPGAAAYYEFAPEEWDLVPPRTDALFDELSRRADALHDAATDDAAFRAHRDSVFATCVAVLEALRAEPTTAPDLLLMFTVSDGGHRDEVAWVRRTSPTYADRFAAYLAGEPA